MTAECAGRQLLPSHWRPLPGLHVRSRSVCVSASSLVRIFRSRLLRSASSALAAGCTGSLDHCSLQLKDSSAFVRRDCISDGHRPPLEREPVAASHDLSSCKSLHHIVFQSHTRPLISQTTGQCASIAAGKTQGGPRDWIQSNTRELKEGVRE